MPHPAGAGRQEQAAHAGRLADAPGGDGVEDVLHGVIDGQAGSHYSTWTQEGAGEPTPDVNGNSSLPPHPETTEQPGWKKITLRHFPSSF